MGSLMALALNNLKYTHLKKHRFWVKGFLRFQLLVRVSFLKKKAKLRNCCGNQVIGRKKGVFRYRDKGQNDRDILIDENEKKLRLPLPCQVEELFAPLKENEIAQVESAFSRRNRLKILVSHKNSKIEIHGETLQCLKPTRWLNDEVINLYLELLKERETRDPQKFLKCHFFNTFFYIKLVSGSGYNYEAVRRWTTLLGYDLIDCDIIFIPIHIRLHWTLAVINNMERKFMYLDSLNNGVDQTILSALGKYLVDEVKEKNRKKIDVSSWKIEYVEDIPQQQNGYDCGMFMLKFIDFYSRGMSLEFSQKHIPYFRLRTAKEILLLRAN